jgi:hypothetical protein
MWVVRAPRRPSQPGPRPNWPRGGARANPASAGLHLFHELPLGIAGHGGGGEVGWLPWSRTKAVYRSLKAPRRAWPAKGCTPECPSSLKGVAKGGHQARWAPAPVSRARHVHNKGIRGHTHATDLAGVREGRGEGSGLRGRAAGRGAGTETVTEGQVPSASLAEGLSSFVRGQCVGGLGTPTTTSATPHSAHHFWGATCLRRVLCQGDTHQIHFTWPQVRAGSWDFLRARVVARPGPWTCPWWHSHP